MVEGLLLRISMVGVYLEKWKSQAMRLKTYLLCG